ncbi:MAG: ComEA family DNA-binding protein [Planctomycetota bacterium]
MSNQTSPSPVLRWLAAGFLGGAATVGLVWSVATRPVAVPLEPMPEPPVRTLKPIAPDQSDQNQSMPTAETDALANEPPQPEPPRSEPVSADPLEDPIAEATETELAETTTPNPTPDPTPDALTTRIRINTATVAQLDLLPGIGPALAERIVQSRRTDGPFHDPEDLERVPGIGPKTAGRMTPYIRFD